MALRPLSVAFDWSWWLGEMPEDWKRANVTPVFKKDKNEGAGTKKPLRLISIPGNSAANFIVTFGSFAIGWIHFQMSHLLKHLFLKAFLQTYNSWGLFWKTNSTYCKLLNLYCNCDLQQAAVWKGRSEIRKEEAEVIESDVFPERLNWLRRKPKHHENRWKLSWKKRFTSRKNKAAQWFISNVLIYWNQIP